MTESQKTIILGSCIFFGVFLFEIFLVAYTLGIADAEGVRIITAKSGSVWVFIFLWLFTVTGGLILNCYTAICFVTKHGNLEASITTRRIIVTLSTLALIGFLGSFISGPIKAWL